MGIKRIVFVGLAMLLALGAWAQSDSIAADTAAIVLKEVEVKANKVRVYADHDEMTLSEENKKFGANAIDAISSLPAFRTQINAGEILNLQNQFVTVVMNGQVVSNERLASYRGQEIKSVKYYPTTPPRYRSYTGGPVLIVEIDKPRDAFMSLNLVNTIMANSQKNHFLDFGSDNINASFSYIDSLNLLWIGYSFAYANYRHMQSNVLNETNGKVNRYFTDKGRKLLQKHSVFVNYQYSTPKNLFSAVLSYGKTPF